MIKRIGHIPEISYGVLTQNKPLSKLDEIAEQVRLLGYAVLDSGYAPGELKQLSEAFNQVRKAYLQKYGESSLRIKKELHTVRAPLAFGDPNFIKMATNKKLIRVLRKLIIGKFILNQQNGVINPPGENYSQGAWHRDLPYQHYVSSTPLAVNALFCLDDFTEQNGSTLVLPASHKTVNFPSTSYIQRNALQVQAKAGSYILLDCMLFHSGGFNESKIERRAVNHVFTIPYFKQQIKLLDLIRHLDLDRDQQELFGFNFQEPTSVDQFLENKI